MKGVIILILLVSIGTGKAEENNTEENKREWFFAKSGYTNYYRHYVKQKKGLYFSGAYFEGTIDREYWFGIGVLRSNEYTRHRQLTELEIPDNIAFLVGDLNYAAVEEESRRRDVLGFIQMLYSHNSWKWPMLKDHQEDNLMIEFNLRSGAGLSVMAYNDVRRYSLIYDTNGDEDGGRLKRSIKNPIDRTFTATYLFFVFSPFLRIGVVRGEIDFQLDLVEKYKDYFIKDLRFILSGGAQF